MTLQPVSPGDRVSARMINAIIAEIRRRGPVAFIGGGDLVVGPGGASPTARAADRRIMQVLLTRATGDATDFQSAITYDYVGIGEPQIAGSGVTPAYGRPYAAAEAADRRIYAAGGYGLLHRVANGEGGFLVYLHVLDEAPVTSVCPEPEPEPE